MQWIHMAIAKSSRLVVRLILVIQRTFPPISSWSRGGYVSAIIGFFGLMRWRSGGTIGSWRWIVLLASVVNGWAIVGGFSLFMAAPLISGLRDVALNFRSSVTALLPCYRRRKNGVEYSWTRRSRCWSFRTKQIIKWRRMRWWSSFGFLDVHFMSICSN